MINPSQRSNRTSSGEVSSNSTSTNLSATSKRSASPEKEYFTFFNRAEKFSPSIFQENSHNRAHCIDLIETGEYAQVVPIAIKIPCILLQHGLINRLIYKGAYTEAAQIAEETPSDHIKQETCQKLAQNQAFSQAAHVAEAIHDEDRRNEMFCLINIEQGTPLELLTEKIAALSTDYVKHNLSLTLLRKSTPENILSIWNAVIKILKTCSTALSDEIKESMSLLLMEKGAFDQSEGLTNHISKKHVRNKIKLLILIEKCKPIAKYTDKIATLSNDTINQLCIKLIEKGAYTETVTVARLFYDEWQRGIRLGKEWRQCEIFLKLIDKNAYVEATELIPFTDPENIILVHDQIIKTRQLDLDSSKASSEHVEMLKNIAKQKDKEGKYTQAIFLRRLVDEDSIKLLKMDLRRNQRSNYRPEAQK